MDVGDVISARDNAHGRTVTATVAKKIVKVSRGVATYSYEVGSETTTKTSSSGTAESSGGGHAYLAGKGLTLSNYTFSAEVDADALAEVRGTAEDARRDAADALQTWAGASMEVGAVKTLPPGSEATAALSGEGLRKTLSLGIPRGEKGERGERGEQGPPGTASAVTVREMFEASHPVGTYIETSGYDPSDYGGTWQMAPSVGPYTWLRTK